MKKKIEKSVFTGKPMFPFLGTVTLGAFILIILIGFKQYFKEGDPEWILILSGALAITILFTFFFNSLYKTLVLTESRVIIKFWLFGHYEYNIKNIKGFDLKEEIDRAGSINNLRIWIDEKKCFIFFNSSYSDINKLVKGLQKGRINYLGTVELKSKYKQFAKWFMIISGILTSLGLFFVQIMKLNK